MHDIKSSLPLQMAVYFHGFYMPAFVVVTFLIFIYKGVDRICCSAGVSGIVAHYVMQCSGHVSIPERCHLVRGHLCVLVYRDRIRATVPQYVYNSCCSSHLRACHIVVPQLAASKGNKLEQIYSLGLALLLIAPIVVFHAYYIQLQTYVYVRTSPGSSYLALSIWSPFPIAYSD
jgi:hypothetical protein